MAEEQDFDAAEVAFERERERTASDWPDLTEDEMQASAGRYLSRRFRLDAAMGEEEPF